MLTTPDNLLFLHLLDELILPLWRLKNIARQISAENATGAVDPVRVPRTVLIYLNLLIAISPKITVTRGFFPK